MTPTTNENSPTTFDPLSQDAPISALLAKQNVEGMSLDQLRELVRTYKTLTTSPTALSVKLSADGKMSKRGPTKSDKVKKLLDEI